MRLEEDDFASESSVGIYWRKNNQHPVTNRDNLFQLGSGIDLYKPIVSWITLRDRYYTASAACSCSRIRLVGKL